MRLRDRTCIKGAAADCGGAFKMAWSVSIGQLLKGSPGFREIATVGELVTFALVDDSLEGFKAD